MDKKKNRSAEETAKKETAEDLEEKPSGQAAQDPSEGKNAQEAAPQKPEDIGQSETEKLKAEAEDYKRKWYSVSAEYENYRKRTASESARRYSEGRADVVKGLFPIADNLGRALAACSDEATKKGILMVVSSFENLLKEEKIVPIDPLGLPFDAQQCEAIMAVEPEEGEESGIVKQVYQKGYLQNGKVLRYAQVVVTK